LVPPDAPAGLRTAYTPSRRDGQDVVIRVRGGRWDGRVQRARRWARWSLRTPSPSAGLELLRASLPPTRAVGCGAGLRRRDFGVTVTATDPAGAAKAGYGEGVGAPGGSW